MREAIEEALGFLRAKGDIIEMARPLSLVGWEGMEAIIDGLLDLQNEDGGWPRSRGGSSSVETTSSVIQIAWTRRSDARLRKGADFLLNRQRGNGGWAEVIAPVSESGTLTGPEEGGPARVSARKSVTWLTAEVASSLQSVGWAEDAVRMAEEFLLASQLQEGGWVPYELFDDGETREDLFTMGEVIPFLITRGHSLDGDTIRRGVRRVRYAMSIDDRWREPIHALGAGKALSPYPGRCSDELESIHLSLLGSQNGDGGWHPVIKGLPSDADLTSRVVAYLITHMG